MTKYVTQVTHLDNGNSFEYVNYNGTWFKGKNAIEYKFYTEFISFYLT